MSCIPRIVSSIVFVTLTLRFFDVKAAAIVRTEQFVCFADESYVHGVPSLTEQMVSVDSKKITFHDRQRNEAASSPKSISK